MLNGKPTFLKEINEDLIRELIYQNGPISKPELSKLSDLSLPTVNKLVDSLTAVGDVEMVGEGDSSGGRKAKLYQINKNAKNIVALYYYNDCYFGVLTNLLGEIVKSGKFVIDSSSRNSALDTTYEAIDALIKVATADVCKIAIGVPGVVREDGSITDIPSIAGWEGLKLKTEIKQKYNIDAIIENDVKLMTEGYYKANLNELYENIVYIYIGKGIGSGIIINGNIYKGYQSFAGEIGYFMFDAENGTLEKQIEDSLSELEKDLSIEKKKTYYHLLALTIVNYICILNPEAFVLRGKYLENDVIDYVKEVIHERIPKKEGPDILLDENSISGIWGAVDLCLSSILEKQISFKRKGS